MKALAFEIAQKIASDRSSHTFFACASVLKEAFKIEGYSDKVANSMAIDGIGHCLPLGRCNLALRQAVVVCSAFGI